jgi:predicted NAD/FAD-dependent oxidoreductase
MSVPRHAVAVVGAGISGVACARVLADAGLPVVVLDRGRRPGGRMARWTRDGRAVDVGAAYLTVWDPDFALLADGWDARGLAHPWTDSFTVWRDGAVQQEQDGPVRWAAEQGLRCLVDDLAAGLDVRSGVDVTAVGAGPLVDGQPVRAVALAMPDPQARDLLGTELSDVAEGLAARWQPVITVVASYPSRTWAGLQGMFVHGSPVSLVVDDGRRRGDQAPVLVAHTTHEVAQRHLDDPQAAVPLVLDELARLVGVREQPVWAEAKRWGAAAPARPRTDRYRLGESLVGLCGDGWAQRPRIEGAWLSGRDLGRALVARLAG